MKDAATLEFAAWFAAYSDVSSGKVMSVLQGHFVPSLQNIYSDLFQTKHGAAILNQIKHAAPVLSNINLKSVRVHEITNFFHDCRMLAFTNGFNNISLYDYCITP